MSAQELHDKTNSIVSEVLDLIASDADFREAMKADPALAMETAGLSAKIDQLLDDVEADTEVSGFISIAPTINGLSGADLKNTTILASNTATPGCGGHVQNRFLPGFQWGGGGS